MGIRSSIGHKARHDPIAFETAHAGSTSHLDAAQELRHIVFNRVKSFRRARNDE